MLGSCRVVIAQWSEHRQLRSEALGLIPSGYPAFFLSVCFYANFPPVALPTVLTTSDQYNYYSYTKKSCMCIYAIPL